MIALTQEKREKRINWLKDRISSMEKCRDEIPFGLSEDESMELSAYKDSLASLTAEPIAHADSKAILKMIKRHTRFFTSFPERSEAKRVGLFIAPPVPDIKLPPEFNESHDSFNEFRRGWNGAISEVKRLNGLGE